MPKDDVVSALLKVENLKANHNSIKNHQVICIVVSALLKVENLKANHNFAMLAQPN